MLCAVVLASASQPPHSRAEAGADEHHRAHEHAHAGLGGGRNRAGHRARAGAPPLPFCTDDEPAHVTLDGVCERIQGAARLLCVGALRLQRARCAELAQLDYLVGVVQAVGLTPDNRGRALYGNASRYQVEAPSRAARLKVGLWQNPTQIAGALIHVGSRVAVHRCVRDARCAARRPRRVPATAPAPSAVRAGTLRSACTQRGPVASSRPTCAASAASANSTAVRLCGALEPSRPPTPRRPARPP
jgi:hypothetical protein